MSRYRKAAEQDLRFRQVHLDFHTSEHCPSVGGDFDPDEFADTLKKANVDSVTCFARCHHGWSYHVTSVGARHPNLKRDLLAEMIKACHARDINVPVYITAGWDERAAREHPEWREIKRDGSPNGAPPLEAGWRKLCFNTPYLDYLTDYTVEVTENYDLDGIFMDIVWQNHCHCPRCLASMETVGLDPDKPEDLETFAKEVLERYYTKLTGAVRAVKPGIRIFHNKGNIDKGRHGLLKYFTHWEIESLPTGGWGYDHFPVNARYSHAAGVDFLGMTGKFHTSWGEFGGYKTPDALLYECNLIIAMGGKCSVGDQLHPAGKIDQDTYSLIGNAYGDVKEKEPWCKDVEPVSDVALFSVESQHSLAFNYGNPWTKADAGAARMLLEHQVMFDVIDSGSDLDRYKVVILPDEVVFDDELREKFGRYIDNGGAVLSSGTSGLDPESGKFAIDFGADYTGESEWEQDFIVPGDIFDETVPLAPMLMYSRAVNLKPRDGKVFAAIRPPYFNRTYDHFCSHLNTPYTTEDSPFPAIVSKKNVIHFAHRVFTAYRTHGQQYLRDMVMSMLDVLCPVRQAEVSMPSGGRMTFMRQEKQNRHILHLLYAVPMHRGESIDVIEDIVPLYNIPCNVYSVKKPKRVYLAPSGEIIEFTWSDNFVHFFVPEVYRHAMVVIE